MAAAHIHTAQDLSLIALLFEREHRQAAQVQALTAIAHQEFHGWRCSEFTHWSIRRVQAASIYQMSIRGEFQIMIAMEGVTIEI